MSKTNPHDGDSTALRNLRDAWDRIGQSNPMWAALAEPSRLERPWTLPEFLATGRIEIKNAISLINNLGFSFRTRRALDFGCGPGRLSQALAEYFDQVTGIDISPEMIRWAESFNAQPARCQYLVSSDPDLSGFSDRSIDFVYTSLVLMHMPPSLIKRYLRTFMRLLADDGVLVFQLTGDLKSPLLRAIPGVDSVFNRSVVGARLYHSIWNISRKIRKLPPTVWEMHWLPRSEVGLTVSRAACKFLSVAEIENKGRLREFRYFVVREQKWEASS